MKITFLLTVLVVLTTQSFSQDIPAFEKKYYAKGRDTLLYRVLYPMDFKSGKEYPLVVFLHGAGERGNDNVKQLLWGGNLFADSSNRKKYPAIVIFPQCGSSDFWAMVKRNGVRDSLGGFSFLSSGPASKGLRLVMELLDSMANSGSVNKKKIYVGGLSMGGMGTFEILWRKPNFFAAAIPICGGGAPEMTASYGKKLPIWIFHGDKDPVVPVSNSRIMVNALKAAGAKLKYTEYPGVSHDSWVNAFAEPDLLGWLFKQQKRKK